MESRSVYCGTSFRGASSHSRARGLSSFGSNRINNRTLTNHGGPTTSIKYNQKMLNLINLAAGSPHRAESPASNNSIKNEP